MPPSSETAKFPLLLPPSKHWLTSLIIRSVHIQLFHAGTNATLTASRQKFWAPTARQCIKITASLVENIVEALPST